jgi:quercetin dioxygenase-like cupin family protein
MPEGTGGRGSYGHNHRTQEEIYFVSTGKVTFKINDDVFVAEPGTAVRVAPEAVRSVHNDGPGEATLVVCSRKVEDLSAETFHTDDFWPEEEGAAT